MPGEKCGIPWINETETLVIGISLSHGLGEESITVVGASVGLDSCLMQFAQLCRVQKKSEKGQPDTISEGSMINLTQVRIFLSFFFLVFLFLSNLNKYVLHSSYMYISP